MPKEPRNDHGARLIQATKAYITAHSREKFSLQAVADALYVNKCYLLRQFRARTGGTLLGFHNQVRCEHAKQMLSDTALSISEVGEAVGFVSSAHFAHVFKKTVGMTPTVYRNAHAAREIEPRED